MFKFFPLLLMFAIIVSAGINVPFQVSNWAAIQRSGEPVTAGLPLPAATVYDLSKLRVVDASGNTVPAQFRPLTKWWYEINSTIPNERKASASVKWVLMDFQADVPAKERASFTLKDDNSGSTPSTQLSVSEASDQITVSTGPLTFKVSKQHFNLFDEVTVNGQQIITSNPLNGGFITSVASASQGLAGGIVHTTTQNAPDSVNIREQGPLKVVIEINGSHFAASQGNAKGLYGYQVFITAYAGKPYIDVQFAVTNFYLEGTSPYDYKLFSWPFSQYVLNLNCQLGSSQSYALLGASEVTGALGATPVRLAQDSNSFTLTGGAGGVTALGGAAISDGTAGVMVTMRDFASNFRKAMTLSKGLLSLELFPEYGGNYWLDPKSRKNHRMRFEFFTGAYASGSLTDLWKKTDAPLRALATNPTWYRDTRAWDAGFAVDPRSQFARVAPGAWTRQPKAAYDVPWLNSGWRGYGQMSGWNGPGNHWNENSCFGLYLCTGNPKDFEMPEGLVSWVNDIYPFHWSNNRIQEDNFYLNPDKDVANFQNTIYAKWGQATISYDFFTGYRSNYPGYGDTTRTGSDMADAGHIDQMYLLEYYLLTGDWATCGSVLDNAAWAAAMCNADTYTSGAADAAWQKPRPAPLDSFDNVNYQTRYGARPVSPVTQGYQVSGDSVWLKAARYASYNVRNTARNNPTGMMHSSMHPGTPCDATFQCPSYVDVYNLDYWNAHHPGVPVPNTAAESPFMIAIGIRALGQYWDMTHDIEIRDAILMASNWDEWSCARRADGTYTGWMYCWADYWEDGTRPVADSLYLGQYPPCFCSSLSEGFTGVCNAYLLSGLPKLYNIVESGNQVEFHNQFGADLYMVLGQSLWKHSSLDITPPAPVNDLAATLSNGQVQLNWTSPGEDGNTGTPAFYQVKYWPANVPMVDSTARWNPTTGKGWPDLNDPLPYDGPAYLAKAANYKNTQEVLFWQAYNAKNTPSPQPAGSSLSFVVSGLNPQTDYTFGLVTWDKAGNVSAISNMAHLKTDSTVGVESRKAMAYALSLGRNMPNPFTPVTQIGYTVPGLMGGAKQAVKIGVYNLQGQLVKMLVAGEQAAGSHQVTWNGSDALGKRVSSGVYLYRLTCGKRTLQKQMVYFK